MLLTQVNRQVCMFLLHFCLFEGKELSLSSSRAGEEPISPALSQEMPKDSSTAFMGGQGASLPQGITLPRAQ